MDREQPSPWLPSQVSTGMMGRWNQRSVLRQHVMTSEMWCPGRRSGFVGVRHGYRATLRDTNPPRSLVGAVFSSVVWLLDPLGDLCLRWPPEGPDNNQGSERCSNGGARGQYVQDVFKHWVFINTVHMGFQNRTIKCTCANKVVVPFCVWASIFCQLVTGRF